MVKVEVVIPAEYVERLVFALHRAGFLKNGNYDYCYTLMPVQGHYRPLAGATPLKGVVGDMVVAKEVLMAFRIPIAEMSLCRRVIREHHPYEFPVFHFIKIMLGEEDEDE